MSTSKDSQTVLNYLEKVNRPYSLNDIVQNLHNVVTKTLAQKVLNQLVSDGKIVEKVYNKQKIYCIKQEGSGNINTSEELKLLETAILEKTGTLSKIETELKSIEDELRKFQLSLTTEDALTRKVEFQAKIADLEQKLDQLSNKNVVISKSEKDEIEKEYEATLKAYRRRKRICMDIFNSILEGYAKSKTTLIDEIGLEIDDESNTPAILKS